MATHSSIFVWRIPWTEEPGRLHSPQAHKESDTTEVTQHAHTILYILQGLCIIYKAYALYILHKFLIEFSTREKFASPEKMSFLHIRAIYTIVFFPFLSWLSEIQRNFITAITNLFNISRVILPTLPLNSFWSFFLPVFLLYRSTIPYPQL